MRLNELYDVNSEELDEYTPTVSELVKKHEKPVDFIVQQLIKGIAVEQEHTSDVQAAAEIALDHINETPDYYDRLETIESHD